MQEVSCDLTVYFENSYWVGEYKRISGEKVEISKVLFDDEPLISHVYNYYLKNWKKLKFVTTYV
ncbi:MAG: DUF2992 family protein [Terrisporobacter sp.]